MDDPGYRDYNDPRLQPPEEESLGCIDCAYYKDVTLTQPANGMMHSFGVCCYEVFQADTFAQLLDAELVGTGPSDRPCSDFKEVEDA